MKGEWRGIIAQQSSLSYREGLSFNNFQRLLSKQIFIITQTVLILKDFLQPKFTVIYQNTDMPQKSLCVKVFFIIINK